MSNSRVVAIAVTAIVAAQFAHADVYNDAVGDEAFGHPHLDIVSVEVQNNLNDIMFTINVTGDPIATDWGKYLVAINSVNGGDTTGNAWGRPISMSQGMDYFIGSWVDWGDGAEVYNWNSTSNVWDLTEATYNPPSDIQFPGKTTSSVTLTTTLASLGLNVGDFFVFDVWTTGGGGTDSAIDALSDPNTTIANWDDQYNSTSKLKYTVVPEPATLSLALMGLGAMVFRRFRRA